MSGIGTGVGVGLCGRATGATLDGHAAAVVAAMTAAPDAARQATINTLVLALKAAGVWSRLDSLFVLAAHDAQAARVDWKSPSRVATLISTPVFTADRGYTFGGVTALDSGFIPSVHATAMTGSDMMAFTYERTNHGSGNRALGCLLMTTTALLLVPRSGTDTMVASLNGSSSTVASGVSDSRGLLAVQREANATLTGWRNGASLAGGVTPASTGETLPSIAVYVGGYNANGSLADSRPVSTGAAGWGARLSAQQHGTLYSALQAYMAAVGANV